MELGCRKWVMGTSNAPRRADLFNVSLSSSFSAPSPSPLCSLSLPTLSHCKSSLSKVPPSVLHLFVCHVSPYIHSPQSTMVDLNDALTLIRGFLTANR